MLIQVPSDLGSLSLKNRTDQNINEVSIFRDTEVVLIYFPFSAFPLKIITLEAKQPFSISSSFFLVIILIAVPSIICIKA